MRYETVFVTGHIFANVILGIHRINKVLRNHMLNRSRKLEDRKCNALPPPPKKGKGGKPIIHKTL